MASLEVTGPLLQCGDQGPLRLPSQPGAYLLKSFFNFQEARNFLLFTKRGCQWEYKSVLPIEHEKPSITRSGAFSDYAVFFGHGQHAPGVTAATDTGWCE